MLYALAICIAIGLLFVFTGPMFVAGIKGVFTVVEYFNPSEVSYHDYNKGPMGYGDVRYTPEAKFHRDMRALKQWWHHDRTNS